MKAATIAAGTSTDSAPRMKDLPRDIVGTASPANKEDWDIVLIIEYKNMAALDGLEEKLRDVAEKAVGPSEKQEDRSKERGKIREVLGTKLVRQLKLK